MYRRGYRPLRYRYRKDKVNNGENGESSKFFFSSLPGTKRKNFLLVGYRYGDSWSQTQSPIFVLTQYLILERPLSKSEGNGDGAADEGKSGKARRRPRPRKFRRAPKGAEEVGIFFPGVYISFLERWRSGRKRRTSSSPWKVRIRQICCKCRRPR